MPMAIGMLVQTLYFLVDLYFVSRLGDAAIAGVGAAGTVTFIVMGLTQMLGVGTVALIAQAVGRKDQPDANLIFNQSLILALICTLLTLLAGYGISGAYMFPSAPIRRRPRTASPICTGTRRRWHCSSRWSRWARRCAAPASSNRR